MKIDFKDEKTKNRCIVVVEAGLLFALVLYVVLLFGESKGLRFFVLQTPIVFREEGYSFSLDGFQRVEDGNTEYINVSGWAVQNGLETRSSDEIKVVLRNTETGKFYSVPTSRTIRPDVTKAFYDGKKYDSSGFEAKVYVGGNIDLKSDEFEIYIYMKNRTGKKLISTNMYINDWIG